ncbi:MAG TPA: hypothetical protein DCP69_01650 [Candidatus Omnitrophica bacterium]|nr:hypothetical protein [Candidatus Omnitrophota bacterium]
MNKKYAIALLLVIAGCGGGGGSQPGPFDGIWSGVEEPAGITPFVQLSIKGGRIGGGHITEQDHFVDRVSGKVNPDGTVTLTFPSEALSGTFEIRDSHLYGNMGTKQLHLLWNPH